MEKHAVYKKENIVDHYNETAENYEQIYLRVGFNDPLKCAELTAEVLGENRSNASVFDIGCGTGLVGQYLKEMGVSKIVGVDSSRGMLVQAGKKQAYEALDELYISNVEAFPAKYHEKFDAVVASGMFAEGHLDVNGFDVMLAATKVGGYCVFATREMYLTQYNYQDKIT